MGACASVFTVGQSRGFAVVAELPGSCWASLCCPCSVICRQPGRAPRCAGLGLRADGMGHLRPFHWMLLARTRHKVSARFTVGRERPPSDEP